MLLKTNIKINDICPNCNEGKIELIKGDEPFNIDYLKCNLCDSSYILQPSLDDDIISVLNRAKFIIDEYNESLINNNEYAHINIIKDIDKIIKKIKDNK